MAKKMNSRLICRLYRGAHRRQILKALAVCMLSFMLVSGARAEQVKVSVNGMVCSFCAQGIKKQFSEIKEIKEVNVDLDAKLVSFDLPKGTAVSDERIEKAIKDAGYDVQKIERTGEQPGSK